MKRTLVCLLALAVVFTMPAFGAERLDLTSPVTTPTVTSWTPDELHLGWQQQFIRVLFLGPAGEKKTCVWSGSAATTLMVALNKANLTSNSLHKRIINQAVTDGCLTAGTVAGSPD